MTNPNNLAVGIVQMKQIQGDVSANIARLEELLVASGDDRQPLDLLLLPEMWTTGFMVSSGAMSVEQIAEAYEVGRARMLEIASRYDCAVYGSLIESLDDGMLANTGLFVTPDGRIDVYRKRHLFGPGGERKYFEGGARQVQVDWRGWRFRLTICYDLRFPIWQRQFVSDSDQYDVLLNCANWPDVRIDAWEILLRARAVENQCYVLATNRTGDGPKGLRYPGYSMVLGPKGEILRDGKSGEEGLLRVELDKGALDHFREKFPVLREIDDYILPQL